MGDFEHSATKPTWLYSSHDIILDIDNFRSSVSNPVAVEMTRRRRDRHGRWVVDGGRDLRMSQRYTACFARALLQTYLANVEKVKETASADRARVLKHVRLYWISAPKVRDLKGAHGLCVGSWHLC